jgi:amino acid adenylation domain-containing protein
MRPPVLIQQYLDSFLQRHPAKVAVTDGNEQLTYQDLEQLSNRLAHCLRANGVIRQDCVVFYMQRSVKCLIAILGILKADAIYVPIDRKSPIERLKKIIADCRPRALICDASAISGLVNQPDFPAGNPTIIALDNMDRRPKSSNTYSMADVRTYAGDQPSYRNSVTDTAYVLYTSGSTGKPKGVMTSHANINNYIDWATGFLNIQATDKILGTAPFHFDMSTFDIYTTLKTGATLCIARENLLLFPERLLRFMEQEEVTIWKGISSLLMYIERTGLLAEDRIPTLRKILFGGESLPAKYLIRWMETYPGKHFYNAYGPTEATGISLCYPVAEIPKNPGDRIPIGKPCKDATVFLLNEDHALAQAGEIGELCIAGTCLSKGYLNDRDKTAQAFIYNSFYAGCGEYVYKTGDLARLRPDGNYDFIDRKDNQVKFMGYRIELCEIEHALLSIPEISDAAVQLMQSAHEGLNELVAFYEAEEDLAPAMILAVLASHLPKYMLPRQLIKVDCIPRNDRGKICRLSLRSLHDNFHNDDKTKDVALRGEAEPACWKEAKS